LNTARERMTGRVFELAVPPAPESVSVCRLFVGAVARHFAIDEDTIGDLKVAVSEAVTNAIKAHHDVGRDQMPVRVRVLCDDEACRVEVLDEGNGFQAPPPASSTLTPAAGLSEGSLGLLLIRALFPEAEIASGSKGTGTTVRFAAKR
jgi:serine/threonine-protein kinase RsbW